MDQYEVLARLDELYDEKSWKFQEFDPSKKEIFDRLFNLIMHADAENRKILFSLLGEYILSRTYHRHGSSAWNRIRTISEHYGSVLILPIVPKGDKENSSGVSVVYDLMNALTGRKPQTVKNRSDPYNPDVNAQGAKYVLFMDDFIASGNQFKEMYKEISGNLNEARVGVYSIVMQNHGAEVIESLGVDVFFEIGRGKAITDGFAIGDMEPADAMAAYMKLEERINVPANCTLGDRQMEALVTMKRTPNSTLPIFWCEAGKEDAKWPAPFVRT